MAETRDWCMTQIAGTPDFHPWTQRAAAAPVRERPCPERGSGRHVWLSGRRVLNFASNNYLGLANHPDLLRAFSEAAQEHGMSGCSSQFVIGYSAPLRELEQRVADFTGHERAAVFSSGYLANLAAVGALAGRNSCIFADHLAHASLLDAARLAGARLRRYPHRDMTVLARQLQAANGPCLVLSDGVFSMDGDIAPVAELAALCAERGALLLLDDAHGIGVLGPGGRGVAAHCGLAAAQLPLLTGTFAKALGLAGAFVAGPGDLIETILRLGRSAIYTTALLPGLAAAAIAALGLVQSGTDLRSRLQQAIRTLRAALSARGITPLAPGPETPIQPVLVGDDAECLALRERLLEDGFLVAAIRPPTVPPGTARLRISLMAEHEEEDLLGLAQALAAARTELGGHE